MKKFRRPLALVIGALLFISPLSASLNLAYASAPEYGSSAITLYELGVLTGTDQGFELERTPTRLEGLIILIKLLGSGDQTDAYTDWSIPFQMCPSGGTSGLLMPIAKGLQLAWIQTPLALMKHCSPSHT